MKNKNMWQYDYLVKSMDSKLEIVISVATDQGKKIADVLIDKELDDRNLSENIFSYELISKKIIEDLTLDDQDIEILKKDLSKNDPLGFSQAINYDVFKDPVKANMINEILDKVK
jgi:hypothetical protein